MVVEHPLCQALGVQQQVKHSPDPRAFALARRQTHSLHHAAAYASLRANAGQRGSAQEGLQNPQKSLCRDWNGDWKSRENSWCKRRTVQQSGGKGWKMKLREGPDDNASLPHPPSSLLSCMNFFLRLTGMLVEGSKHGIDRIWLLPTTPPSSLVPLLPQ